MALMGRGKGLFLFNEQRIDTKSALPKETRESTKRVEKYPDRKSLTKFSWLGQTPLEQCENEYCNVSRINRRKNDY